MSTLQLTQEYAKKLEDLHKGLLSIEEWTKYCQNILLDLLQLTPKKDMKWNAQKEDKIERCLEKAIDRLDKEYMKGDTMTQEEYEKRIKALYNHAEKDLETCWE